MKVGNAKNFKAVPEDIQDDDEIIDYFLN